MREGSAGGEGVGGAASGSADDTAISLDDGEKMGVSIKLKIGDVWGRSAVNHQFVENFKLGVLCQGRVGDILTVRGT